MNEYARIRRALAAYPWAIVPETLETIVEVLALRAQGKAFTDEEIAARVGIQAARPMPAAPRAIAVIPIMGVISHRINSMSAMSGGTSTELLGKALAQAIGDPSIAAVVLDVDSGGGQVFGVQELADQIHAARGSKPIVAVANAQAGSAAYWIASQADELVVTPSGQVGSVGVYAVHEDLTGAAEQKGVKVTYISAGARKLDGQPFTPLDEEARVYMQARVDAYYDAFVRAVARGRGVPLKEVRGGFGEGRMVGATQALSLGMVDRVEPFQATLDRLVKRLGAGVVASVARAEAPQAAPDMVEPDEDGGCPDGYEMGEDGMCHMMAPAGDVASRADLDARLRWQMGAEIGQRRG